MKYLHTYTLNAAKSAGTAMSSKQLEIYLPWKILRQTQNGRHVFYSKMKDAFEEIGFKVSLIQNTPVNLQDSLESKAYLVYHRNSPQTPNTLEVRPAYVGPFWAIDRTAIHSEKRVYLQNFRPDKIKPARAKRFFDNWTSKIIGDQRNTYSEVGFVLIAMQGILLRQRFWQSMTPINMVKQIINAEPDRRILIKLHPGEKYSDIELDAIKKQTCDRVEIVDSNLAELLSSCAYTVSMNSSVSFKGLLYKKPGILFGDMDFHHVFQSVGHQGNVQECVNQVFSKNIDFEKYVFWFLHKQMINAKREWAKPLILSRCAELGWDLGDYVPSNFRPS